MKSEFAALLDLAISKGVSHSNLLGLIHETVLDKYRDEFPKSPVDAAVLVNEISGHVRIFSGDRDITPPKFANTAASVARQAIINRLGETTKTQVRQAGVPFWSKSVVLFLGNVFFWGYNLYFVIFNLILALSFLFDRSGDNLWERMSGLGFVKVFLFMVIFVAPVAAIILALRKQWHQKPFLLLRLFFLFELPVVAVCVLPLVMAGSVTPFLILITLLALALPGIFYLYQAETRIPLIWHKAVYFTEQFVFLAGAYLVFLYSFFVPLILGGLADTFFGNIGNIFGRANYGMYNSEPVISMFFQMGFGLLVLILVTAALMVPYLILFVIWRALNKTRRVLVETTTSNINALDAVFAVLILTVSVGMAYQPSNNKLLNPLKKISQVTSFSEKEDIAIELSGHQEKLKQLISDQRQVRLRYLLSKDDTSLLSGYKYVLHTNEALAELIQNTFITAAYPFVYQGEYRDTDLLESNYEYLFGSFTKSTETSVPTKSVLLTYRKIDVKPEIGGLAATVIVEEEYENSTNSQQEVIYEFTLPRGAVMTDLRLGPDLEFAGIVAPRGAAQKTYERQLQIRRDPALLEETGPHQYRLRVFPIPAKNDFATLKGRRQKVSYTYATGAIKDGYPLPQVTRRTNVYTTSASRIYSVTGLGNKLLKEDSLTLPFPEGINPDVCLSAVNSLVSNPVLSCNNQKEILRSLSGTRIALFFDVSAGDKKEFEIEQELRDLAAQNTVDLYKYNDKLSEMTKLTPENTDLKKIIHYFGKSNGLAAFANFNQQYDVVFIVNESNPTLSDTLPFAFPTRVYLINDSPGPFSMKLTSQILQTGGDVVNTITDGIKLYAMEKQKQPDSYVLNSYLVMTGIRTQPGQITDPAIGKTALDQLTNHAVFRTSLAQFNKDISGDVAILDNLHSFSAKANLVSPYSSLLALVNEQQVQTLERFEEDYNRYQDASLTEQFTPQPIRLGGLPMMQPMMDSRSGPFGIISNPLMESQKVTLAVPGGNSVAAPTFSALSNYSSLPIFLIINGVLLVTGLFVYLLKLLRTKNK